jgi:Amidohydrolase family
MHTLRALKGLLAIPVVAAVAGCTSLPVKPNVEVVLITSVSLVDAEKGVVSEPRDVFIRDGRIARIAKAGNRCQSAGCRQVDGGSKFLMPGLWDLHVHLEAYSDPKNPDLAPSKWYAPLAMSYGVLGLRDLGSRTDKILALRSAWISQREMGEPAPLLKVAGQSFSGKQPWGTFDHTLIPETPEQAGEMVRMQLARGVDFIKVHDFLAPEIYAAVTQAAVAEGRGVIGHLRPYSGPLESAAAGQRDFDHLPPELLAYCGPDGEAATNAFYDGWYAGGPGYYERSMTALYKPARCKPQFDALAMASVSVTPTLSVRAPVRARTFDAARRYLPYGQMQKCSDSKRFRDDAGPNLDAYLGMISNVVKELVSSEVIILAGTDGSPESCGVPGLILLDELQYLVDAGLSRQQALYSATRGAALKAGVPDHGRIVEGALADLVLLEGNPLEYLQTLEEPLAIISAGRHVSRAEILALREGAARYARGSAVE